MSLVKQVGVFLDKMDLFNKKKTFIGKAAPLGYVAGLGRG